VKGERREKALNILSILLGGGPTFLLVAEEKKKGKKKGEGRGGKGEEVKL